MPTATHITAYNDLVALTLLLEAHLNFTHAPSLVIIVDNSPIKLALPPYSLNILHIHRPENLGTAGAINLSIEYCRDNNFTYLWILDHDSRPSSSLLDSLLRSRSLLALTSSTPIGVVAPLTINRDDNSPNIPLVFSCYKAQPVAYASEPVTCDFLPAAGMLLHLPTLSTIILPSSRYFLDLYDFALGLTLRKNNLALWLIPSLQLSHQVSRKINVTINGQHLLITDMPTFRVHLVYRNSTYLYTRSAYGINRFKAALCVFRQVSCYACRCFFYRLDTPWAKAAAAYQGWLFGLFCLIPQRRADPADLPYV